MSYSSSTYSGYSRFIFLLMGAIFLVVGLGLAIGLGGLPYAGGAMTMTGGIFAVVGVILLVAGVVAGRNAARTDAVLQTGIPGSASITGLTQTGVYVNENPQIQMNLLVQLPGEVPYAASVKQIVPLMLLGRLSSGAPLSVRVDQLDRAKIVIDWNSTGAIAPQQPMLGMAPMTTVAPGMSAAPMGGMPMAGMPMAGGQQDESLAQVQAAMAGAGAGMQVANPYASPAQANYTVEQLRGYLRQSGLQASAHVDRLEDTGQVVGDERVFKMEMTLSIPGQPPQKLPASAAMVPVAVAHKLFQGMNVPVRYAAENHDLLMVEWDKV
jgi:hypothetical protein